MRLALLFSVFATVGFGCGGDPPIIYLPPQQMMMMNQQPAIADFGGRVFEFSEASVFALGGSFRLEVGALAGTPLKAGITIRSNSNSDEATGQIVVDTKCTFTFVTSSFPTDVKIQPNMTVTADCTFDQAASVLHLGDAVSDDCQLLDDSGPCPGA